MNLKILLLFTIIPLATFAQNDSAFQPKPPVFGQHNVTAFDTSPDSTVYSAMQQFCNASLPLSYLTFPMIGIRERSIERVGPLVLGEGMNGYILEGNMDLNFVLNQGQEASSALATDLPLIF